MLLIKMAEINEEFGNMKPANEKTNGGQDTKQFAFHTLETCPAISYPS